MNKAPRYGAFRMKRIILRDASVSKINKILPVMVLEGALVGVAGCSSVGEKPSGADSDAGPSRAGLASVEVCSLLKSVELEELGLESPGDESIKEETVCDYFGATFDVAVHNNETQTVESYGRTPAWESYKPITVNGRPAAQAC